MEQHTQISRQPRAVGDLDAQMTELRMRNQGEMSTGMHSSVAMGGMWSQGAMPVEASGGSVLFSSSAAYGAGALPHPYSSAAYGTGTFPHTYRSVAAGGSFPGGHGGMQESYGPSTTPRLESFPSATSIGSGGDDEVEHQACPWVKLRKCSFDGSTVKPLTANDLHRDISPDELVDLNGVPAQVVIDYLQAELHDEAAFLSLPSALLLVFVASYCFLMHDKAHVIRACEDAIAFDITSNANFAFSDPGNMGHKAIEEVNSAADFFSWFKRGLMPLVIGKGKAFSEGFESNMAVKAADIAASWPSELVSRLTQAIAPELPENIPTLRDTTDKRTFLYFNRLIGGVRLVQSRATSSQCGTKSLEALAAGGKGQCSFDSEGSSLELNHQPTIYDVNTAKGGLDEFNGDPVWFGHDHTEHEMVTKLLELENSDWFDWNTVRLDAQLLTYNAHFDVLSLTSVSFHQSRSGHIWKNVVHDSLFMNLLWSDPALMAMDCIFVLFVSYLFLVEVSEICKHCDLRSYFKFWNVVDWVSILFSFFLFALFTLELVAVQQRVVPALAALDARSIVVDQDAYLGQVDALIQDVRELVKQAVTKRYLAAFYPIILMLRLFKAFDAQPRLAVVTRTISSGFVDFAHFLLVFLAVFLSYAVMGHVLFGCENDEFSSLDRAVDTCFQVLMGNFDMAVFQMMGRFYAFLWFASYMTLVLLIMLNMLLALVMDTYAVVKSQTDGADTLFEQGNEVYFRWWNRTRGQRQSLTTILDALESLVAAPKPGADQNFTKENAGASDQAIMTKERLCLMVPKLEIKQAYRILISSVARWKLVQSKLGPPGVTEGEMGCMVQQTTLEIEKLNHLLDELPEVPEGYGTCIVQPPEFSRSPREDSNSPWDVRETSQLAQEYEVETLLRAAHLRAIKHQAHVRGLHFGNAQPYWKDMHRNTSYLEFLRRSELRGPLCEDPLHCEVLLPLLELSIERWSSLKDKNGGRFGMDSPRGQDPYSPSHASTHAYSVPWNSPRAPQYVSREQNRTKLV